MRALSQLISHNAALSTIVELMWTEGRAAIWPCDVVDILVASSTCAVLVPNPDFAMLHEAASMKGDKPRGAFERSGTIRCSQAILTKCEERAYIYAYV